MLSRDSCLQADARNLYGTSGHVFGIHQHQMNRQNLVLEKCRQEALELHIAIESNKWKMKC